MCPSVKISGDISYTSQKPWFRIQNIKDYILFKEKLNDQRYKASLKYAYFEKDVNGFPMKD